MDGRTWRRPTLPWLEPQYHGRWGFSRPSSGWDRVRAPRQSHQVVRSMPVIWSWGSGVGVAASDAGVRFWRVVCVACRAVAPVVVVVRSDHR